MTFRTRVFTTLGAVAVAVALVLPSQSIAQGPSCQEECSRAFRETLAGCARGAGGQACRDAAADTLRGCMIGCQAE